MSQKIFYSFEADCNCITEECPSCGTRLEAKINGSFKPLPLLVAVCASFLMVGVMIGVAA